MKLPFFGCDECFRQGLSERFFLTYLELREDSLYSVSCKRGHEITFALQQQKFEILFEIGANAIIDGYNREALSCFSASLERFYEFYVKLMATKNAITKNELEKAWKHISSRSERELGAFVFVYALENKESPDLLHHTFVKLRNDVIHKGRIPSKGEAIEYGSEVLQLIRPIVADLRRRYQKQIIESTIQHLRSIKSKAKRNRVATYAIETIINLSETVPENDKKPFGEIIEQYPKSGIRRIPIPMQNGPSSGQKSANRS